MKIKIALLCILILIGNNLGFSKPVISGFGIEFGSNYFSNVTSKSFPGLKRFDERDIVFISVPYGINLRINYKKYFSFQYSLFKENENFNQMTQLFSVNSNLIVSNSSFLNQRFNVFYKMNRNLEKHTFLSLGIVQSSLFKTDYLYRQIFVDDYGNISYVSDMVYTSRGFQFYKWAIIIGISRESVISKSPISILREISFTSSPIHVNEIKFPAFVSNKVGVKIGVIYNFK